MRLILMFDSTDPTQLPFLEPTPADGGACTCAAAMQWGEMGMGASMKPASFEFEL